MEIIALIKDDAGIILIENINPNLLKKISKIAKNEKISEEEAINEIIRKGINAKIKIKYLNIWYLIKILIIQILKK